MPAGDTRLWAPPDFDVAAAGAVADEHYGAIFDAIVAANAGEGSRDAVLAALVEAMLPASLAGRPEADLVTAMLRDNLDGYLGVLDPPGPRSAGDDARAQLENVRCTVVVAAPQHPSPLQRWMQRVVLDSLPDGRPATLAVRDGPELPLAPLVDPDGVAALLADLLARGG